MPNAGPAADPDEVLKQLGSSNGRDLGAWLLRDALQRKDSVDAEMALIVAAVYGVSQEHLAPLIALAGMDWHHGHEQIATELGRIKSPASVEALRRLAEWVPEYLAFDESRALAVKAVHALADIPGEAAEAALMSLTGSDSEIVRTTAMAALGRHRSA